MEGERHLQLWPGGQSVAVKGDYPEFMVQLRAPNGKMTKWIKPDKELARKIHVEELAEMYQERDVLHCDSSLVEDLLKASDELRGDLAKEFCIDNIQNQYKNTEKWTITECKDYLDEYSVDHPDPDPWSMSAADIKELLTSVGIEIKKSHADSSLRDMLIDAIDEKTVDGLEDWQEAARELAMENPAEIYEWWRVTDWLGEQLLKIGEPVLDTCYGKWWGRTCTGQQYIMDGTLQEVASQFARELGE